ncbi:tRNA pseudouridine(38/39) synthase isoform X2 [Cephus cinctus]|uniref:tRNA pseudouridine(38/39) synthase isoform X2 n=1 Tax=Cephus cinctus TaxID=211228 RepID=A0AAJ7FHJ6_CEPCN|nr:tRNA pseudouridine(38/39) synthase isoform X2 [Cephus cinctus]
MTSVVLNRDKSKKLSTKEELSLLDKENLIDRILQLEAHNFQLKKIISKTNEDGRKKSSSEHKSRKNFDFSKSQKRHILLKFYYLGWDYHGFAVQEDTTNTVEHYLFEALIKSCCIQNRETSNYHRCGRTDKGVSAFSQVISLDIRSRLSLENQIDLQAELPYCKILNRLLPKNIRCIAWSPASDQFSARFDCKHRMYKYFFPRGNLNINTMNNAVKYIMGHHDFRNICKMDVANGVVNFNRSILHAEVSVYRRDPDQNEGYDMCQLIITSQAFLWHQIRCIMGVLLLVGQGNEKPEVMLELLDVEKYPCKPQYNLAHEIPLNLFHCEYEESEWFIDNKELMEVIKTLQQDWALNTIKSTMIRNMLMELESKLENDVDTKFQNYCLLQGVQSKVYQPLMKRMTCVWKIE